MTDQDPAIDELVSAYLDGEATPEEVARVEADPLLVTRAEQLAAVSAAIAAPVTLDSLTSRRLREAALAGWDDARDGSRRASAEGDASAGVPGATSTFPRRVRQHRWLGVAAAVAGLVALAGAGAVLLDSGSEQRYEQVSDQFDHAATTAGGSQEDAASEGAATLDVDEALTADEALTEGLSSAGGAGGDDVLPDNGDAAPDLPTSTRPTDPSPAGEDAGSVDELVVVELGAFPDRSAAAVIVQAEVDAAVADTARLPEVRSATLAGAEGACVDSVAGLDGELAALVWAARLTVAGDTRLLLLFELTPGAAVNGTHRLVEVSDGVCAVLSTQTFTPA